MKILKKIILPIMLVCTMLFGIVGVAGCTEDEDPAAVKAGKEIAASAYEKIKYIDANLGDRDCYNGATFKDTQDWIKGLALDAGYDASAVTTQDVTITKYVNKNTDLDETYSATKSHETDGKYYTRSGKNYVEDPEGNYVKVEVITENIIITKAGKSEKQIIVGAHYDGVPEGEHGTASGDNGSGVSLAITTAEKIVNIETNYTIKFVFFTAEEIGCVGSTAYANAMTAEEVENTLYMINMDSLVCGDYCHIYGGVANFNEKVVTQTEAFDNAMAIAKDLGLDIRTNPWTWDNVEPDPKNDTGMPKYPSPSTGDWSDHKGFMKRGIKYLYFEATNWDIPGPFNEYDGYGETADQGMIMNTEKDYLAFMEEHFPGRIQHHLSQFAPLLYSLVTQTEVKF